MASWPVETQSWVSCTLRWKLRASAALLHHFAHEQLDALLGASRAGGLHRQVEGIGRQQVRPAPATVSCW